ncbi:MAG: acylphosphatase [Bilifractor sp.]|jgi:acylphosphatase
MIIHHRIVRKKLVFSGTVQGVGFRWHAKNAARELGVTGWVRNEWDDTVVMEVQGTQKQISQMILILKNARYVHIDSIQAEELPLVKDEKEFSVRNAW